MRRLSMRPVVQAFERQGEGFVGSDADNADDRVG